MEPARARGGGTPEKKAAWPEGRGGSGPPRGVRMAHWRGEKIQEKYILMPTLNSASLVPLGDEAS